MATKSKATIVKIISQPPELEKKYLFGWTNIKFVIKELVKMYSAIPSFFAKKRIESGIAFAILQWGMIYFLVHKIHGDKMDMTDMLMWASIEGVICGYMINQIQKEKKRDTVDSKDNTQPNIVTTATL